MKFSWLRLSAAMHFCDMQFLVQHVHLRDYTSFLYISFVILVFTSSPLSTVPFLYIFYFPIRILASKLAVKFSSEKKFWNLVKHVAGRG